MEWPDKQMWWGYLHTAGTIHVKRWFGDPRDYTEACIDNPFVARVMPPFESASREEAEKRVIAVFKANDNFQADYHNHCEKELKDFLGYNNQSKIDAKGLQMTEKQTEVTVIDITKIKELQALDSQKRQLEKDLDEVKLRREELEKNLLEQFAEAGIDSITVDGKKVYLKRDTWTSALEGDRAKACTFLKEHGLDFYVNETFNATSISAYVREHRNEEDGTFDLPEGFTDYFKISDTFKIRTGK